MHAETCASLSKPIKFSEHEVFKVVVMVRHDNFIQNIFIGVRDVGRGVPPPSKFCKTIEIRSNARENQENLGRFIKK